MSQNIVQVDFKQALSERYLSYALSTIMSRSLPDVRDGLKPVHRRLIYAMHQLKLNPQSGYKKCARVVGDVMGKFHPHGDGAIYNALARLAQDFSVRYPLIDGQGNFGNIDGDNPAAMRYTEARLSDLAMLLLEGIEQNAVDLRATYDGEEEEPTILPAAFPNILANGATGIAVGMATSIPPHNLDELCQALVHLIDHPNSSVGDLLKFVPGPDFPTGGILCEQPETIQTIYETGRGSLRLRSSWISEPKKGGGCNIVITSIPYMVEKAKLIERIADLIIEKKAHYLDDIVDESTQDVRIVLVPKSRNIDVQAIMESLFKVTDLEVRVGVNLNVLDSQGIPKVLNLKEILSQFLDFRRETSIRLATHRQNQIEQRLEILAGYLVVYLNLDEVIRIIRDEDDPKKVLMETYSLSDMQVDAILNMRLRSLRKLQEIEIRQEFEELKAEAEEIRKFLETPALQWKKIKKELSAVQKRFGKSAPHGERRTEISNALPGEIVSLEIPVEREDVTIICSAKGWIRTVKGHGVSDIRYKEGDEERFVISANTADKLIILAKSGRCFTLLVDKIPRTRGFGEALRLMIELDPQDEIVTMITTSGEEKLFLIASSDGRGFVIKSSDFLSQTRLGRIVITPVEREFALFLLPIAPNHDHIAIIGENHKLLTFPLVEIPQMMRGRGVTLQKYKDGKLSDIKLFSLSEGLFYQKRGQLTKINDLRPWTAKRASAGKLAPVGFSTENKF